MEPLDYPFLNDTTAVELSNLNDTTAVDPFDYPFLNDTTAVEPSDYPFLFHFKWSDNSEPFDYSFWNDPTAVDVLTVFLLGLIHLLISIASDVFAITSLGSVFRV